MGIDDETEADDTESLADVQRRLTQVTGDRKISVGFLRAATHRDRIPKSAWAMIELAIEAANDSIPPEEEDRSKSQE